MNSSYPSNGLLGLPTSLGGLGIAFGMVCLLLPLLYAFYFLVTLPWRRRDRAAMVLDLLELGRLDGRTPAETLATLGEFEEARIPIRLHLLTAHLESGLPFEEALARVPRLLPPSIRSMLQIGFNHGNSARTLEICRQALIAPIDRTRAHMVSFLFLGFLAVAVGTAIHGMFLVFVLPKFRAIAADLGGADEFSRWGDPLLEASRWGFIGCFVLGLMIQVGLFSHVGGPRVLGFRHWFDRLRLWVPWHRDRTHRDFAAMLAMLLDAGVPESKAIQEAANATENQFLMNCSKKAAARLAQGDSLPHAIRELDTSGEFRWRLENAFHGSTTHPSPRFTETLRGWINALEARAAQRETHAMQSVMCLLILGFGLSVGLHCAGILGWLVAIIEAAL